MSWRKIFGMGSGNPNDTLAAPDYVRISDHISLPQELAEPFQQTIGKLIRLAYKREGARVFSFPKLDAAVHEASHCVVAAREGFGVLSARIWPTSEGVNRECWFGEYIHGTEPPLIDLLNLDSMVPYFSKTLAGRVGERLFASSFNLVAGLDELVYANLMTRLTVELQCAGKVEMDAQLRVEFFRLWSYLLLRTEETLRGHAPLVRQLAKSLATREILNQEELLAFVAGIPRNNTKVAIPQNLERRYDPIELLQE
jgi:hypothetical protein